MNKFILATKIESFQKLWQTLDYALSYSLSHIMIIDYPLSFEIWWTFSPPTPHPIMWPICVANIGTSATKIESFQIDSLPPICPCNFLPTCPPTNSHSIPLPVPIHYSSLYSSPYQSYSNWIWSTVSSTMILAKYDQLVIMTWKFPWWPYSHWTQWENGSLEPQIFKLFLNCPLALVWGLHCNTFPGNFSAISETNWLSCNQMKMVRPSQR